MSVSPQIQVRAPVSVGSDETRVATTRRAGGSPGFDRFIGLSILVTTLALYAAVIYGAYVLYGAVA